LRNKLEDEPDGDNEAVQSESFDVALPSLIIFDISFLDGMFAAASLLRERERETTK
jgi:hypothetical protein